MRGSRTLLLSLAIAGAAGAGSSCGDDPVEPSAATQVTISPAAATVPWRDTASFSATVLDQRGRAMGGTVAWASSDDAILRSLGDGRFVAEGSGTVEISARLGGATGRASVTAQEPVPVSLQVDSLPTLEVGDTARPTAVVRDAKGRGLPGITVQWSSGDGAVVSVEAGGVLRAVGAGSTTITARVGDLSAATIAVVRPQVPGSVLISGSAAPLEIGDSARLAVVVLDSRGRAIAGPAVTWSSSAPAVASVDAAGLVRGLAPGTARIRAQAGAVLDSVAATVLAPAALELGQSAVTVTALNEQVALTGAIRGAPVAAFRFELLSEARWLGEHAVLDSVLQAAGTLRAAAPGRTRLLVHAAGSSALPDTLQVTVAPARPIVYSVTAPARVGATDEVVVRGYRAADLGTVRVSPALDVPPVSFGDSATLRLRPGIAASPTCGGMGRSTLLFDTAAVTVLANGSFQRQRAGERALQPGDSVRLSATDVGCLKLAADGDAFYALAYFDPQYYEKDRRPPTEFGYYVNIGDPFTGSIQDRSVPPNGAPVAPAIPAPAASAVDFEGVAETRYSGPAECSWCWWEQQVPFVLGDTIDYQFMSGDGTVVPVQVVSIVSDYYLIAVPAAEAAGFDSTRIAAAERALAEFERTGVPLLQHIFGPYRPTSNAAASQLLVVLRAIDSPQDVYSGRAGYRGFEAEMGAGIRDESALYLMAHEAQHVWTAWFRTRRAQELGEYHVMVARSSEGTADLFAYEVLRRYHGFGFLANTDRDSPPSAISLRYWGMFANHRQPEAGYGFAGMSLLDFTTRLVQRGVALDDALRTVSIGILEGPYGCGERNCVFPGLIRRMQEVMGPGWNIIDAMLTTALSGAIDDLTESPTFQVPITYDVRGVLSVWHARLWNPHASITTGTGRTADQGTWPMWEGALGFFEIADAVGGTVTVTTSAPSEWLLVRVR